MLVTPPAPCRSLRGVSDVSETVPRQSPESESSLLVLDSADSFETLADTFRARRDRETPVGRMTMLCQIQEKVAMSGADEDAVDGADEPTEMNTSAAGEAPARSNEKDVRECIETFYSRNKAIAD